MATEADERFERWIDPPHVWTAEEIDAARRRHEMAAQAESERRQAATDAIERVIGQPAAGMPLYEALSLLALEVERLRARVSALEASE